VDVLFNGGIGTYVKASHETHADAGDRSNDTVRVDANQLRARVVLEGGNLGLTQAARIEYALAGGRVNADFVDNSAGVDISDREVNLKILLASAVRSGRLSVERRDSLLHEASEQVVAQVLADNAMQAQAISVSEALGPLLVAPLLQTIRFGAEHGFLNPSRDALPDEETAARRQAQGVGLTRPEIAVLLAMSKSSAAALLLGADEAEDTHFSGSAWARYLPPVLADFADLLATHPLRREIAASVTANEVFNRMGSGVLLRVMQLTGRSEHEPILGFVASRDVLGLPALWREIDTLDLARHSALQTQLLVEIRSVAERTTRWFLRSRSTVDPVSETTRLRPGVEKLAGCLLDVLPQASRVTEQRRIDQLVVDGAPVELARDVCALRPLSTALDLVEAAHDLGADLPWMAEVYFDLAERLDLPWLRAQASYQSTDNHWLLLAKTSIRDELSAQQRRLAVAVHSDLGTMASPREATDTWLARTPQSLRLYLDTVRQLREAPEVDLAMLSVAVDGLRTLLHTARAGSRRPNGG
jgi:glutamate dehydrogenase